MLVVVEGTGFVEESQRGLLEDPGRGGEDDAMEAHVRGC